MSIAGFLLEFAVVGLIVGPILGAYHFYLIMKIGRLVASKNTALWNEMKPGFYSNLQITRDHRQRFLDFVHDGDFLSFGLPNLDALVRQYKKVRICAIVTIIGAPIAGFAGLMLW